MTDRTVERERLKADRTAWLQWGPYVSERAWGTVREDYSEYGTAWDYFPHDHARSRVFRWSEDGLGGICDLQQRLCLAFSFWNGKDPILKERIFGLTGNEGNHGEDAKEYWFYLDNTPSHSWMRWRYLYPQEAYPYNDLVAENRRRGKLDPEYELLDTGVFDHDRYWEITVDYAKAGPDDLCIRLTARNAGPDEAILDVLPTLWFRNTWAWGIDYARPSLTADGPRLVADHHTLGSFALVGDGAPEPLVCENETNRQRLWGVPNVFGYPKDGIADHIVSGSLTVDPSGTGTKGALHYRLSVAAGQSAEVRLRLSAAGTGIDPSWEATLAARSLEADSFYALLTPADASADEAMVMRQAFAGMLWGKQYFHYNVSRWLHGDPSGPTPPAARLTGRNSDWWHVDCADVISMPDPWEYPWFAAWDLAFHCVTLAHLDPRFAKDQLLLMGREWYMHPDGQMPAYEWAFGDVNPPVHAWAALRVFELDGGTDYDFLERIVHKLLLNFTWWVNRKDAHGNNLFEGGFLGLDNIGPIDRSATFPDGGILEQSDGTAWMACFCLSMLEIALVLAEHDRTYEDLGTKFSEHFSYIATAMNDLGLWDEGNGFYYDLFLLPDGTRIPIRVHSTVGLIPLYATTTLGKATLDRLPEYADHLFWFCENRPEYAGPVSQTHLLGMNEGRLLSLVTPTRLRRILSVMLDEKEFLSPYGLRALSANLRDDPFVLQVDGQNLGTVDYEPGESTSGLFGGNSNWRGPVWFPTNYLTICALRRFDRYFGEDFTVEYPTGSGRGATLSEIADDLTARLVSLFLDNSGRRPVFGDYAKFQNDPAWHGLIPFHEYFHGDTGKGLGASHQTGWTGLVADLIASRRAPEGEAAQS